MLTIREIVRLTGRDRGTDSGWIRAGDRDPNAVQGQTGRKAWRVPVKDLVAAGDLKPSQVVEVPQRWSRCARPSRSASCEPGSSI